MAWLLLIPLMVGIFTLSSLMAFDEEPRIEEHNKLTDYLLKLGNDQAAAKEGERMALLMQDRLEDEIPKEDSDF